MKSSIIFILMYTCFCKIPFTPKNEITCIYLAGTGPKYTFAILKISEIYDTYFVCRNKMKSKFTKESLINNNTFKKIDDEILTKINRIDFRDNGLMELGINSFDDMIILGEIYITHNKLTTFDGTMFRNNKELIVIDFMNNQIRILKGSLNHLIKLRILNLENNRITQLNENIFKVMCTNANVKSLNICGNPFICGIDLLWILDLDLTKRMADILSLKYCKEKHNKCKTENESKEYNIMQFLLQYENTTILLRKMKSEDHERERQRETTSKGNLKIKDEVLIDDIKKNVTSNGNSKIKEVVLIDGIKKNVTSKGNSKIKDEILSDGIKKNANGKDKNDRFSIPVLVGCIALLIIVLVMVMLSIKDLFSTKDSHSVGDKDFMESTTGLSSMMDSNELDELKKVLTTCVNDMASDFGKTSYADL